MDEATALTAIKIECKLLEEVLTDEELLYFLNKYKVAAEYSIRKSIYSALTSIITTEEQSFKRGNITVTKVDLLKLRTMYASFGTVELYNG